MIDGAAYDPGTAPDSHLSGLLVRHGVPDDHRIQVARAGIKTCAVLRGIGAAQSEFEERAKAAFAFLAEGTDVQQMISLARIVAVWVDAEIIAKEVTSEYSKMAEDPTKVPRISSVEHGMTEREFQRNHPEMPTGYGRKPHHRFIERMRRDYVVEKMMKFYRVAEIRLDSDEILQTSGV